MKYLTPNVADEDEYEYYTEDDSINNNEDTDDMYNEPEAAMSESYIYSNKLTINSGAMLNGTVVKLQKTEEPEIKTFETNSSLATNSNESSSKMENIRRFLDVSAKLVENELDRLGDNHYVWIPHSRLGFCLGRVVFEDSKNETYTVKLEEEFEATHNQMIVDIKNTQTVSQSAASHYCADMCALTELNEASILHTVRCRYEQQLIHTRSGPFCVVVNPWKPISHLYSKEMINFYTQDPSQSLGENGSSPPHIYSIAKDAYNGILGSSVNIGSSQFTNQSILITGESGAGKTENTKRIIEYLIYLANQQRSLMSSLTAAGNCNIEGLDSSIISANIALEAFANAKTIHNSNSSRMGKFICINFDQIGRLVSARIDCYLLEKSRIVSQNPGDRNFHIFYQLLSNDKILESPNKHLYGVYASEKRSRWRPYDFRFLSKGMSSSYKEGDVHDKFIDDSTSGRETEAALDRLGFSTEEKAWIREVVLAVALIGEIRFGERRGLDISFVEDMTEMDVLAQLLGLAQNTVMSMRLMEALTQPTIKVGDCVVRKGQCLRKTLLSASALAKVIYERLFKWVVKKCNTAIECHSGSNGTVSGTTSFVGVLDMAGFEIMAQNSFEQLCINYTNERLQQLFNEFIFIREQEEYRKEGIRWTETNFGLDLQPTIDLIEKPLGILSLLQEQCIMPNGNDSALLDKLQNGLSGAQANADAPPLFALSKHSTKNTNVNHFTISHYAGQVGYNIEGWIEKNRDAIDPCILDVLTLSNHPLIAELFGASQIGTPNGNHSLRRGSLSVSSTISYVYREQLSNLMATLNKTTPHFIRCIVPNYECRPFVFEGQLVLNQLRCNGVLEGIRICRRGYPNRLTFPEFIRRYRILAPNSVTVANENVDMRDVVIELCRNMCIGDDRLQIGKTKVFCKVGLRAELELWRKERINALFIGLQAWIRWHNQQKVTRKRYNEWMAVQAIQNAVRENVQLRNWSWFKLWIKVRKLIPLMAERKLLGDLKEECESLRRTKLRLESKGERLEHSERGLLLKIQQVEEKFENKHQQTTELLAELRTNEDLLAIMEKKFDDQHLKVMRLNETLRDNTRVLERMEEEKTVMKDELDMLHKKYQTERIERESADEHLKLVQEENVSLNEDTKCLQSEVAHLTERLAMHEREYNGLHDRNVAQEKNITELNLLLCETNDKVNALQPQVRRERTARQKAETEVDELETEVERLNEELKKAAVQREASNEHMRMKNGQIAKLERRLEDKTLEMDGYISELKNTRKQLHADLEDQLGDWRRKTLKLETENAQLKCRIEAAQTLNQQSNRRCSFDRDSSVDSDHGGERYGSNSAMSRSYNGRYPFNNSAGGGSAYSGSLNRRRKTCGELPERQNNLCRSSSNISALADTGSLSRHGATNNVMTTSFTTTVDSGLLTRCSSSASTTDSQLNLRQNGSSSCSSYLQMGHRLNDSERKSQKLEREIHTLRQDFQLIKRELDVYKHSLQDSERQKEALMKQLKALNLEKASLSKSLKAEEERSQAFDFESRKNSSECTKWQQKFKESQEDAEVKLAEERKKYQAKLDELKYEYDTKIRHLMNVQRNFESLQTQLAGTQCELDKAVAQVEQLQRLQKSHSTIGETWEAQYRVAQQELQALYDENAALKSKIRRQYKQIEILTQQSEIDGYVNSLESAVDKIKDRIDAQN